MSIFDLRARSYCNLGELISWNISDDYAQGNGLIKYKGQLEINGLVRPAVGDPVLIGYEQPGVLALIPRKLRVQSVFCDPANFITKVDVACKLTFLEDLKGIDDGVIEATYGENSDYSISDKDKITIPVAASYAMSIILAVLGITAASNPLQSRFSMGRYVFKEGYVKALDDLLISECFRGFLDENEILQIRSVSEPSAFGPVITPEQIVALGSINVGRLPGDAVSVRYSSIKIEGDEKEKEDDESDGADMEQLKARWEYDETKGELAKSIVQYTIPEDAESTEDEDNPSGKTYSKTWQPITVTKTTYKIKQSVVNELGTGFLWGRDLVESSKVDSYWIKDTITETRNGILSAGAGNVCSAYLSNGVEFNDLEYESSVVTIFEYDDDGNEIRNTKITSEPEAVVFGRLGLQYYYEEDGAVSLRYSWVVTEKVVVETATVNGCSKTYTTRWLFYPLTQEGQQAVAETRDHFVSARDVQAYLDSLLSAGLVCVGTSTQSQTKSWDNDSTKDEKLDPVAEGRPSLEELNNDVNMKKASSESRIAWAIGSYSDQRRVEFTLPNAPDDYYISTAYSFIAVRGYAHVKAVKFGITENRMLLGNRNGMNVQLSIGLVPPYPMDAIHVNAHGYVAQYLMNGTHYVGNKDGIVVTSDLMYWAGAKSVDTPVDAWIPMAPGTTGSSLPKVIPTTNANPSPVNAVAIPTGFDRSDLAALFGAAAGGTGTGILVGGIAPVYETELTNPLLVPPFTLTVEIHGGIGIGASMEQYGYALSVSLDVAASVIGIGARFLQFLTMAARPGAYVVSSAGAKVIYSKFAVELPGSFIFTGNASGNSRGYRLNCQAYELVSALNYVELYKDGAGSYRMKAVVGSFAISGGVAELSKQELPPTEPIDPYFSQVELLLPLDGSTSSTIFDASSNANTISSSGATLSSTGGPFGNGCAVFDGTSAGIIMTTSAQYVIGILGLETTKFSIEAWIYITAYPAPGEWATIFSSGDPYTSLSIDSEGVLDTIPSYIYSGFALNTWCYYNVSCTGYGQIPIYVNGESKVTWGDGTNLTSQQMSLGYNPSSSAPRFTGKISNFRFTIGVDRKGFEVPTANFPTSGPSQPPYSPTATAPGGGATYGGSGDSNLGNLFNGLADMKAILRGQNGIIFGTNHQPWAYATLAILMALDADFGYLVVNGVTTTVMLNGPTPGGWGGTPVLYTYTMPAPAYITSISTTTGEGSAIGAYGIYCDGVLIKDA